VAKPDDVAALSTGIAYRFSDWPNPEVPNWRAGVYTIWGGDQFLYVGMAGRGMADGAHLTEEAMATKRNRGLRDRLNSHASGRRSGDQFCVYVCDRLVLPSLGQVDVAKVAGGHLSLDALTREYIRDRLTYRFFVTETSADARKLEATVRVEGLQGTMPMLNPG
jgi:hypothetical protein